MNDHYLVEHSNTKYHCEDCDYVSVGWTELFIHRKVTHPKVKHTCDQCDYDTRFHAHLVKHKCTIHLQLKCDMCRHTVDTLKKLKEHFRHNHRSALTKAVANIRKKHNKNNRRPYSCLWCSDKFVSENKLKLHESRTHTCSRCGFTCLKAITLRQHQVERHGDL